MEVDPSLKQQKEKMKEVVEWKEEEGEGLLGVVEED